MPATHKNIYNIRYDHPLSKLIQQDITSIARITLREKNKKGLIMLSSREYYVTQIMFPLFEIENKIQDLNCALLLIGYYPNIKKLKEDVSRERYIIYHLEYYFISQIALFDRILHFCNTIYELGLPDRYVSYDLIKNHSKVSTNMKKELKIFNTYLEKTGIRKIQNTIKHKERLKDDNMYNAALFEMSAKIAKDMKGFGAEKDQKEEALFEYRRYIKGKREAMQIEIKKLEKFTKNIIDIAYPLVKDKYDKFK